MMIWVGLSLGSNGTREENRKREEVMDGKVGLWEE